LYNNSDAREDSEGRMFNKWEKLSQGNKIRMNIFIDTNVFLSFYHLSSDDLEELKKLSVLAREGKVVLFLPDQVVQEFKRNRTDKIADAIKRLKTQRTNLQIPQMAKQYKEYKTARIAHGKFDRSLSSLVEKIEIDAANKSLEADSVIEDLFDASRKIPRSSDIIEKAKLRMDFGDPPGKKGALGDAVNWESLLEAVPDREELFFISEDGDYFSGLDQDAIEPYLAEEWTERKFSRLIPYHRISSLFIDHFPNIELASELEKDLLIQQLASSSTFSETHTAISKLSRFSDFTKPQINAIVSAAISNDQIYWIAKDPDVRSFIVAIVEGKEDQINSEYLEKVQYFYESPSPA